MKELAERLGKEHIAIRVKASTAKEYRRNLRRFILHALGQLTATGITGGTLRRSTTTSATSLERHTAALK